MKEERETNLLRRCLGWRRLLLLCLMMVSSAMMMAQDRVTGKVVDASGDPVIGASVVVKGTSNGVVTDLNGNFSIAGVPQNAQLVISYVGCRTQTLAVNGRQSFNVSLEEDKQQLDEVVVVGYGVQRKSDVTGALTRVGEKELNLKPVNNAFEALQAWTSPRVSVLVRWAASASAAHALSRPTRARST